MASAVETLIRKVATKGILTVAAYNRERLEPLKKPHPYLSGIHTPMDAERTLDDLTVTGTIPVALDGRYIRIGPNPVTAPNPASYHWFTGDGMVHGVRLKDGKALWYRNRWIKSKAVSADLGQAEAPGPRNGLSDTVNTNVLGHGGETWALVEAGGYPVRINEELETIAHDPFGGTLQKSFSAHPHLDPETGEMHAICYQSSDPTIIRHVVVDKAGKVRREEPITVNSGPMIHDCMITKNFVIIMDLTVTFSMKLLLSGASFPYKWNPDHQARIGLLPREGTNDDVIWCDVSACQIFHPANAYETDDGKVIFDACVHDSMFAESTQGPDSTKTPLERWTIDPVARSVNRAVIDAQSQEFPRPDERFIGKHYRYAFTMALRGFDGNGDTRLIKHDLVAGTREIHDFGLGRHPGEFAFIPRADDAPEGDGWLMGYVVNMNDETTDLVILDATNFSGEPQAVIHIPHRIPPGFHGNWVVA